MRLRELEPDGVARDAALCVIQRLVVMCSALGAAPPPTAELTTMPLYRRVRELAAYAIESKPLAGTRSVEDRVKDVADVLDREAEALTRGEPATALEAVLQGAVARDKLDRGEELAATELALLVGYDRDAVLALAKAIPGGKRADKLPGKPWRFRASKALRAWLDERLARAR